MKTEMVNKNSLVRKWHIIDAKDQILGRLASKAAYILQGKNKPTFSTNIDAGDNVIIINAKEIKVTGNKALEKTYFRHSTYPGGEKIISFQQALEKDGITPVVNAIRGMLPKNSRGRAMFRKLHVYAGESHPHVAQKPEPCAI